VYQFLSTVFIALLIVIASPKLSESEFVFTRFENRTGFQADGLFNISYICMMGVLMSLYGLSGYESGATLSEETANAEVSAPQGMVKAVVASVFTGFIFILGVLYACQGSIDKAINGLTDQAVVNIFSMTFEGQTLMPQLLTITLLLNIFLCGFSHMTVTTRITYALVRDGALPGSSWLNYLNPETSNPDRVLSLVLLLDSALCLLPLLSTTAFTAITQITTIGY
jgi:amino acid transporter